MPKLRRSYTLSETADQVIDKFSKKWESPSHSEALEKLLLHYGYLDDLGFSQFQETLSDELACTLRIAHKGLFYCMHGVPNKLKLDRRLIETLEICCVCKKRSLGLTEKSIARSGAQSEPSPHLNMVDRPPSLKTPFSYAPDRTHSSDPFDKPASVPPFNCPSGHNRSYCTFNACEQRPTCKTSLQR